MSRQSIWHRLGRAVQDTSFLLGAVMVVLLVITAAIGPEIAPHNPYLRSRIQWIDGEMVRAPIEPCSLYPLGTDPQGRDLLSLLLHGTRTTLAIAFIATTVRMILGLILGAITGWWPGSVIDRIVTALTELLAAVPGLILAMLLVFAIGIRRGQIAFVVAISVVGWGEVAQIMRSHVLTIRKQLFVEAARAVGLSSIEILSRHVLPNLLATMLALTALQMGSALLLLGELGFVSVFIGGGGTIAGDVGTPTTIFFEVPDWGAMLGSTWRSFRALPWLPAVPAVAFFISIFSFNIFGYGLQRFSEKGRFYPSGWSVLRFLGITAVVLFGLQFILARTGPEVEFKEKAAAFDVSSAWIDLAYLSDPELGGRYPGSDGAVSAATYIAQRFKEADLTPFPYGSYFQTFSGQNGQVTAEPMFVVLGPDGEIELSLTDRVAYDPELPFDRWGAAEGILYPYISPDFVGDTLTKLVFEMQSRTAHLTIRVVPDNQLKYTDQAPPFDGPYAFLDEQPYLLMGESAAETLMAKIGYDKNKIRSWLNDHPEDEYKAWIFDGQWVRIEPGIPVWAHYGLEYAQAPMVNVVGYIPGIDVRVQTQRILVVAPYTVPTPMEGLIYPGADDNASGVAVMLEVLRLWRQQDFVPNRTVVFAAFDITGGRYFTQNPILPMGEGDTWTTLIIYGVGAGDDRLARLEAGGSYARTFDQSARIMNTRTQPLESWPFFFAGSGGIGWTLRADPTYSGLVVTRPGDIVSGTPADTREHLDPELLAEAGETIAHYLMVLSSQ
jgi:ABC-type dipeptide/oligopeptide/nickel transport system permease subunit